jgi:hypothetical protein
MGDRTKFMQNLQKETIFDRGERLFLDRKVSILGKFQAFC